LVNKCLTNYDVVAGKEIIVPLIGNVFSRFGRDAKAFNYGDKPLLNPPFLVGVHSFRRKVWETIGGYNVQTVQSSDVDFCLRDKAHDFKLL